MFARHERELKLALALASATDEVFDRAWSLTFGCETEWQRLVRKAGVKTTAGVSPDRFPLEDNLSADGIGEICFPEGYESGGDALAAIGIAFKFGLVGFGSAMLYLAQDHHDHRGDKLVITGCTWACEDGYRYVVIYDRIEQELRLELVSDLGSEHSFLVR